ncbi:MAG: amidohydrolase [Bacteroidales bacterium]|nr:amidohydrolase [Bacteroidales bacterium]MDT8431675.1 amidohydrolase [Bacteroidales bacterium]
MKKTEVDLLVKDATVYTVDDAFSVVEAFVVNDGRIQDTGSTAEMEKKYTAQQVLSLDGKFVYPGWNDAHCHFIGYGISLNQVDLAGTGSVEEIIDRCREFAAIHTGTWITGRGWDQNDWEDASFPDKSLLDTFFPDTPVLLKRIDGHAAWVNSRALELAGVHGNIAIEGGDVLMKNGAPGGILIDNAITLVERVIPKPGKAELVSGILKAQEHCFAVGLTSVSDAGLSTQEVQLIDSLQQQGSLKMRINAWLEPSEENFKTYIEKGVQQNDQLTISTLKLYADGALGSRGARMLEPYADDPGNKGLFVNAPAQLEEFCRRALENGYQVATHCIGDAANRKMLEIYSALLEKGNDRRWRIEHAQIIHPVDFNLFGDYHIVPSVQTTHATSDMYWAEDRLGGARMEGAYAYKTLLDQLGWIPNGSDFPVESINPLYGFYAAVARKDHSGYPEGGFLNDEALSREEALRAMTSWAAKAAFEETFKGSIEKGKLADFVVTEQDIMTMNEAGISSADVLMTWSGGEKVYGKSGD